MRFHVILNTGGGTLRTLDMTAFEAMLRETLERGGHTVRIKRIEGEELPSALEEALKTDCDVVMAGGGDGTVSAAAGAMVGSGKALAVLPAGTMNLFARSLSIPLGLEQAVAAFADGVILDVDLADANGRIFVHQFSVGLHAKLIKLRERRAFRSRLGKMRASVQAGLSAIFRPPRLKARLIIDGAERYVTTAGIGISNNVFGEGHLPYTDNPAGGVLGVYITRARRKRDFVGLFLNLLIGRWQANAHVDVVEAEEVMLELLSGNERFGCAIDGELCDLNKATTLRILPAALRVLLPNEHV